MERIKIPLGRRNADIQQQRRPTIWLWEGVIAFGAITLLSAPEKTGKTTLLSLLLDRRRAGGQLLDRAVLPGQTIVCTEESDHLWSLRQPPLDFGSSVIFRWPWCPVPGLRPWRSLVRQVCDYCLDRQGTEAGAPDLVVIDTAISFLPLQHRNPRLLRRVLGRLSDLKDVPVGVLVINQSRTVHRPLAALADIVIDMSVPRRSAGGRRTRRRVFTGVGRDPATLEIVHAELNHEGTDYVVLPDAPLPPPSIVSIVQNLLAGSPMPLTHHHLMNRWPGEPPDAGSLWRALTSGVERGLFTATGKGTKSEPHRYGLAMHEQGS